MNTQKILIAGIVGGIFSFLLGWVVFGVLLKDMDPGGYASVMRPEEDFVFWSMLLSNICWAVLLSYIFVQWANINTLQGGAMAGAITGFLAIASFDFGMYAMTTLYSLQSLATDIVINIIMGACVGGFIGWWLGWRTKK
ncbi:MAG TPA: hypothetical protein PKY97_01445 [Saprospiraceae bacterium]|jgi:hypothetical protein|nr:hypothetical protein [Saprospiraceae bacterium]